jgi:hypothetical protein
MFSKSACIWSFYIMFLSLTAFIPIFVGIGIIPVFISIFPLPRAKRVFVYLFIDTLVSLPILITFLNNSLIAGEGFINYLAISFNNSSSIPIYNLMFSVGLSLPFFLSMIFLSSYFEVWCCERVGYIKRVRQRINHLK